MDMKEFTAKLEEATKKLSAEERASLVKFSKVFLMILQSQKLVLQM